jgi:hypothetical protein
MLQTFQVSAFYSRKIMDKDFDWVTDVKDFSMPASPMKNGLTFDKRLARAETLLVLALLIDTVLNPWMFAYPGLSPAWKTIIKMAVVVGCFGPLMSVTGHLIDNGLAATRSATASAFSTPRIAVHIVILSALFLAFFWTTFHRFPWV